MSGFNPLQNEGDMFKVLLWVAGCLLVLVLLVLGVRAVF